MRQRVADRGSTVTGRRPDPLRFIRANMQLVSLPPLPEIRLYMAHQGSGLRRLGKADGDGRGRGAPYWAFPWAGGLALARHILDHPETVAGRRVFDLGAGSGLVAIAAALAGAHEVTAAEIDAYGIAAIGLNAAANRAAVRATGEDPTGGPPPPVDLVLAGDVYYERALAERMTPFFDRCLAAGVDVLIGDPGRLYLPRARLGLISQYSVRDVGASISGAGGSAVFVFQATSVA